MTTEPSDRGLLARYFEFLDARRVEDLLAMFAPDGVMITKGGTAGRAVVGLDAMRTFYLDRGPAVASHIVTNEARSASGAFAEGLVRAHDGNGVKFFLASATTDGEGRIARYTTLVWDGVDESQIAALVGHGTVGAP